MQEEEIKNEVQNPSLSVDLQKLSDLGFKNQDINEYLLKKYDVNTVADMLLAGLTQELLDEIYGINQGSNSLAPEFAENQDEFFTNLGAEVESAFGKSTLR